MRLLTVGHGTLSAEGLAELLRGAAIGLVVDVRTAPGSRRYPHFGRDQMEQWLPAAGLQYRWERRLGGFRRPNPDSLNVALRHPSFRAYADYMASPDFNDALDQVLDDAEQSPTVVMCAETLWWRCHRRLIADAVTLLHGVDVSHLGHDGKLTDHRLTDGARLDGDRVLYDAGQERLAPSGGEDAHA